MAILVGNERFEDAYDAAVAVREWVNFERTDVSIDAWQVPEQYIGPMFDTVVTEDYIVGQHAVQVQWFFTDAETDGLDAPDWPYDNGTMGIVVDGDYVQEVE